MSTITEPLYVGLSKTEWENAQTAGRLPADAQYTASMELAEHVAREHAARDDAPHGVVAKLDRLSVIAAGGEPQYARLLPLYVPGGFLMSFLHQIENALSFLLGWYTVPPQPIVEPDPTTY